MSHAKTIVAIILMTVGFGVLAEQSGPDMNDKKTLVISYDYTSEKVLKESTAKLHRNSEFTFHGADKNVDVILLGEKGKTIIPDINESFLLFDKNFQSVRLYLQPTGHWTLLSTSKDQINKMKEKLKPIKDLSTNTFELDIDKLNDKFFENEISELISEYELEHYKIFFIIKKLNTPKEIHPRDQDYFQLLIRVENKLK